MSLSTSSSNPAYREIDSIQILDTMFAPFSEILDLQAKYNKADLMAKCQEIVNNNMLLLEEIFKLPAESLASVEKETKNKVFHAQRLTAHAKILEEEYAKIQDNTRIEGDIKSKVMPANLSKDKLSRCAIQWNKCLKAREQAQIAQLEASQALQRLKNKVNKLRLFTSEFGRISLIFAVARLSFLSSPPEESNQDLLKKLESLKLSSDRELMQHYKHLEW